MYLKGQQMGDICEGKGGDSLSHESCNSASIVQYKSYSNGIWRLEAPPIWTHAVVPSDGQWEVYPRDRWSTHVHNVKAVQLGATTGCG
jgi:hypothetical protein